METMTYEDAVGNAKTQEIAGAFPAIAELKNVGDFIMGEYLGSREVKTKNGVALGHSIVLERWRGSFLKDKLAYSPAQGDVVSCMGKVIDGGLKLANVGDRVGIKFLGMGEKRGTNNPARLFKVDRILA